MSRRFDTIYQEVIGILDKKLPTWATYHCTDHTKYVVEKAEYIAKKEKVSNKDVFLIKIAALYHDIGYIENNQDHEEIGCRIVRKELPKYKFTKKEIDKICGMIMATKIPQQPQNHHEQILADADLEYLATDKFKPIGDTLYTELKHFIKDLTRKKWNDIQISFMSGHQYHTDYCRRYKEHRKIKNIEGLKKLSNSAYFSF